MKITKRPIRYDGDLFYELIVYLDETYPDEEAPKGAHLIKDLSSRRYWIEELGYISAAKKELCRRICEAPPWDDAEDTIMLYIDDLVLRYRLCIEEFDKKKRYAFYKHREMIEQAMIVAYSALDFLDGFRV